MRIGLGVGLQQREGLVRPAGQAGQGSIAEELHTEAEQIAAGKIKRPDLFYLYRTDDDPKRDYQVICDVSGDSDLLDTLISRLAPGGEVILAGFYSQPLHFQFAPAFMREARLRAAAEWQRPDLLAVQALIANGLLTLDGLITHHAPFAQADTAYRTAFGDVACLKMVLDWTH